MHPFTFKLTLLIIVISKNAEGKHGQSNGKFSHTTEEKTNARVKLSSMHKRVNGGGLKLEIKITATTTEKKNIGEKNPSLSVFAPS